MADFACSQPLHQTWLAYQVRRSINKFRLHDTQGTFRIKKFQIAWTLHVHTQAVCRTNLIFSRQSSRSRGRLEYRSWYRATVHECNPLLGHNVLCRKCLQTLLMLFRWERLVRCTVRTVHFKGITTEARPILAQSCSPSLQQPSPT